MNLGRQNIDPNRYQLIPRTLTFIISDERVLLLELAQSKGAWSGRYNGVGGHVEQGEQPHQAASREVKEETGLEAADLMLCGLAMVDTGSQPGVALFFFAGEASGELEGSGEGRPRWVPLAQVMDLPLMEDLPTILPQCLSVYQGKSPPFSALYSYDGEGRLQISLKS